MRIRKRAVPLPLSSLSPVPLSDPHLWQSPVVQLHLHNNPLHYYLSQPLDTDKDARLALQPSDQPIGGGPNYQLDATGAEELMRKSKDFLDKDGIGAEGERSPNDSRKGSCFGAEMETMIRKQSCSAQQVRRWFEGESAFPLKKRRGNFDQRLNEEMMIEKDKKIRIKINKKCVPLNGMEEEDKEIKVGVAGSPSTSMKKKGRGSALMEGSRCSRVNGRGWRCCQQTLVGYALCEHHLGKGRLRSMNSVRSRSTASKKTNQPQPLCSPSLSLGESDTKGILLGDTIDGEDGRGDEKKPLMIAKKKMKLGMIKARSISSLLGQENNATAVTENSK